ncbi:MAG TPA: DNA repair protein RecN [Actinomycetes bacterium]
MLEEMRISGLGVIDDAVLELSPGLTVVSGETGAGKTMVVTGLGLLFGGRADPGAVRAGARSAAVEGRLRVDPTGLVAARAEDAGGELDDGVLVLARTVSAEGRSRAYLGGRGVPAGTLAELADSCVAVHGQSDQSRLLQPAHQRAALDSFAGAAVTVPFAAYSRAFDELRAVGEELAELTTRARERAQEADVLRFGLAEIEAVAPEPGEAAALAVEEARLGHSDALRTAADTARAALVGEEAVLDAPDATGLVGAARASLDAAGVEDPELTALAGRLRELGFLLTDVGGDLASYSAAVETDPVRLATVQERRAAVTRLVRKYADEVPGPDGRVADPGDETARVLAWAERAAVRLAGLDGDDDRIGELRARREELLAELAARAGELSAARTDAARRFSAEVTGELAALAMVNAAVEVAVSQTDAGDGGDGLQVGGRRLAYGRTGVDDVEVLLRPHAGAPSRSLQRGASGGELSRVMLAVEVVLAGADPVPTLVFDEVDAGVGGKAAVEVGRRLATLARSAQVIVVTHLPQVAAFADAHLVVRKTDDGVVTRSGVVALDDPGRLQELSRMLAGIEESKAANAHARELLDAAAKDKHALIG